MGEITDMKRSHAFLTVALLGGVAALGVRAFATTGTPPVANGGPSLIDNSWLLGLAGDSNRLAVSGLTAAGTNQATAAQLPCGNNLVEADTVSSGTGLALCWAYQGASLQFYNNGSNNVVIYPNAVNNPLTAAQDTINNTTSVTVNAHTAEIFFAAKNGVWAAK